ncbi:MAG: isoprenyl transferase [Firmicutes bacterium]|nr:isoprenyl transferase [Bacillota bacterium]
MSGDLSKTAYQDFTEEELLEKLDYDRLPRHISIIMDGNRRWAKAQGLPGFMGHSEGVMAFRRVMVACCELGINVLTVYAFSSENWRRTEEEINVLMELFESYCYSEKELMKDIGVQFRVIGKTDVLSPRVLEAFRELTEYTADGNRMVLNVCINYGSRYEILEAAKQIAEDVKSGKITSEEISEELFSEHLYTKGLPDPDLMIRTSGELRISNFLLWQNAYAEFWFTDLFWPDFDKKTLLTAILDYQGRDRRFGGGPPVMPQK